MTKITTQLNQKDSTVKCAIKSHDYLAKLFIENPEQFYIETEQMLQDEIKNRKPKMSYPHKSLDEFQERTKKMLIEQR